MKNSKNYQNKPSNASWTGKMISPIAPLGSQTVIDRLASIAHRLSTVCKADRILFLEKGTVLESGTHDQLIRHGQRYAQFYAQQFKL